MVGIIVINYKMEELTIRFVQEELSKISTSHLTVIVNNSENEESDSLLCERLGAVLVTEPEMECNRPSTVYVLSTQKNLGFARANNLGALFCKKNGNPAHLLFANNDIQLPDNNVVEKLIERLESLPDAGVIGPRVIGLDGKEQSPYPYVSFWDRNIWMYWSTFFYSKEKKTRRFQLDYQAKAKEGFHYYVMGCFFMARSADFFECGMMDPHTFLYAEEPILSERMSAIGKSVYYYPGTSVLHAHGATTLLIDNRKKKDLQFESEVYYYKTYRHTSRLLLWIGGLTHVLMKEWKRFDSRNP